MNSKNDLAYFKWKGKENESYHKIFHQYLKTAPKDNGKYICICYFIKGWCNSGCNQCHRLAPEGEKAFNKWVNEMREKKKNNKHPDFQNGVGKSK